MAFRIADSVERGWLDASERGYITGEIWLCGRDEPLRLNLKGFPMQDLAGRMVHFENPDPRHMENIERLDTKQNGIAGDITASRKAYQSEPPYKRCELRLVNVFYLEWFSETNGRMVIEAGHYAVQVHGEAVWTMSDEDEIRRQRQVAEGMNDFMDRVEDAAEERREVGDGGEAPMDEFEWEHFLKESDERTDKYGRLLEQYMDHPDRERIIAREMGWDRMEDLIDADERGLFDEQKEEAAKEAYPELAPDPETEGVDWIRMEDGDIRHPLAHRAFELSVRLHDAMKDLGLEDEEESSVDPVRESVQVMTFAAHMLSAKLAGALNSLGYDRDLDIVAGMVVALLKRALTHFNEAVHRLDQVSRERPELKKTLGPYRDELFAIREEMLRLMDRYRQYI